MLEGHSLIAPLLITQIGQKSACWDEYTHYKNDSATSTNECMGGISMLKGLMLGQNL